MVINPSILDSPFSHIMQMVRDAFLNLPYKYAKMSCMMKMTNLRDGSRGVGFWNTMTTHDMQFAWFMQQDGVITKGIPYPLNGMYAMILISGRDAFPVYRKIPVAEVDEKWHNYTIDWQRDKIEFYYDGVKVLSEKDYIPDRNLAFHAWVDNSVFLPVGNNWHLVQQMNAPRSQEIRNLRFEVYNYDNE